MSDRKKIGKQTQPKGHKIIIIAWDDEKIAKKNLFCDQNKIQRNPENECAGQRNPRKKNNYDKHTSRNGNRNEVILMEIVKTDEIAQINFHISIQSWKEAENCYRKRNTRATLRFEISQIE